MKRTLLFMAFFCITTIGFAQKKKPLKITEYLSDKPLDLVLFNWKLNYNLDIDYLREETKEYRISASITKQPLLEAMTLLLRDTDLSFQILGDRKVMIRKNEGQLDRPVVVTYEPEKSDFTATGTVRDADSGESLPFAEVVIAGTNNGNTTNLDGYFTLLNVPSDTTTLEVHYVGYQTKKFQITPEMDVSKLVIEMKQLGLNLAEILVTAEQEEQMLKASTGVSTIGLAPAQLTALPSLGERDIFRSLQLLPGVSGSNESSSGLFVRGGTPDQNLVLFDGFTVYHVDHLFGFYSAFNSNAIKDVQLYKGGFESKFGGRLSSVVEITGKDGNTKKFDIGAGISMLSVNAFVEAPFAKGKGSFLVAGRRSFQSDFYNNIFEDFSGNDADDGTPGGGGGPGGRFSNQQTTPNSYFYDLNAKATYRTEKDIFSFSFYNGADNLDNSRIQDSEGFGFIDLDFSFKFDVFDKTNWGNTGAAFKWSRRWSDKLYSNASLSYSNYFSERERRTEVTIERDSTITNITGNTENNDLKDASFKWDWEYDLNQNHQLGFGLFGTQNDIEYDYLQNDTTTVLSRDDAGFNGGIYLQTKSTFNEKLIVTPGLRANYVQMTGKTYLEPRLSAIYLPTKNIKVKMAAGRYHQFANRIIREDVGQGSRDFWILSDGESVPVSRSDHLIGGVSYETNGFLFDVEGYYKTLDGITEYTTRFVVNGFGPNSSLTFEENFFQGTGIAKGIEFLAQKKMGKYTGWIGYTLGSIQNEFEVFGEDPFFAAHDQTHELKIVQSLKLREWTLATTFVYATGRPFTAPTGAYEVDLLDGTTAQHLSLSDKNENRLPDYHRFDVSLTRNFPNFIGGKATAGLSVYNIYGRDNVWYKEYEIIEGVITETNVTLLGFTPSLFFTWALR